MTRLRHILVLYRRVEKTPIKNTKKDPKPKKKGLFCHVKNAQKRPQNGEIRAKLAKQVPF